MSDALRKVQAGQPLAIPASAYNAFIDAAIDFRQRTAHIGQGAQPAFQQATIILVRNDSGSDRQRFEILGVDAPVIDPSYNEEEFKNRMALACVSPVVDTHEGRFVVLAEPVGSGKIGRAFAAGVCAVKINVIDETEEPRFVEIAGGTTANLDVKRRGSAGILWRVGGTGVQWAVIRFGKPIPLHVFPVNLSQAGGSQGDESYAASWTYNVYDIKSGILLESSVDPTSTPHKWKRPSIGQMIAADFGYAHYQDDGSGGEQLVLGWINEMVDQEACETSGSGSGSGG
jgi:hypothetical protein